MSQLSIVIREILAFVGIVFSPNANDKLVECVAWMRYSCELAPTATTVATDDGISHVYVIEVKMSIQPVNLQHFLRNTTSDCQWIEKILLHTRG